MKENKKFITRIVELILDQIAEIYLYFLAVYFVCLVFSLLFKRWKLFFDWEIFLFCVVLFGILALMSKKGRKFVLSQKNLFEQIGFKNILSSGPGFGKDALKKISLTAYLRTGIIIMLLWYALSKGISPVNFLVLGYALGSILFVIDSRIAAVTALFFLACCPVLLILEKKPLAETMAIYAYYFLIICVLTQIREYTSR